MGRRGGFAIGALVLGAILVLAAVPGQHHRTVIAHVAPVPPPGPSLCLTPDKLPCGARLVATSWRCPRWSTATNSLCTRAVAGRWAGETALVTIGLTLLAWTVASRRAARAGRPRGGAIAAAALVLVLGVLASGVVYVGVSARINNSDE